MGGIAQRADSSRIDGLDLLRFLLALSVVVYHLAYRMPHSGMVDGIGQGPREFLYGRYGVQAFFIISGMVIASSARHRSFADFAVNRIVRLQPAILICASITLAASVFIATGREPVTGLGEWFASVTLAPLLITDQWQTDWSYWSLVFELRFYLLAGLFFLFFRSARAMLIGVAIWLAVSLLAILSGNVILQTVAISDASPCFALGVLIYLYASEPRHRLAAGLLGVAALGLMPLQLMKSVAYAWQAIGWDEAIIVTLAIVALVLGFSRVKSLGRFGRIVRVLGAASYPLYLVHQFVGYYLIGRMMVWGVPWAAAVLIAIVLVTAIGVMVAVAIEPVIAGRIRMLLEGLRRRTPAPA